MDERETSQSDRAGQQEEQVPTSPCASYEKPRVPLNNLKMKFERGEDAMSSKVFTAQSQGAVDSYKPHSDAYKSFVLQHEFN